jgi:hypothetical protein
MALNWKSQESLETLANNSSVLTEIRIGYYTSEKQKF